MYPVVYPRFFGSAHAANDSAGGEERSARLLERVPGLSGLKFTLHEAWPGGWQGSTGYVRHVDPEHARARFELPCLYGYCSGGAFDLTNKIVAALERRLVRFMGVCACSGRHGTLPCTRTLHFVAAATYQARPAAAAGARLSLLAPAARAGASGPAKPGPSSARERP